MNKNSLETLNKFTDYFSSLANDFESSEDINKLRELNTMISEMIGFLREEYQTRNSKKAKEVISSMSSSPSSKDKEILEDFMVGDAKAYIKEAEQAYEGWKMILNTYATQIEDINENPQDTEYLLKLLGKAKVLQDALNDMNRFLQEKQRIEQFRIALSDGVDEKEARFYKDIMKYKLNSRDV